MTEKIVKMDKNSNLFRKLNDCGLISYSEYLFLMSLLTKPRYSVEIYEKITHTQCGKMGDLLSIEKYFVKTTHIHRVVDFTHFY